MASHPLEPDSTALITDTVSSSGDPFVRLRNFLQLVVRKVNGLLSFGTGVHGTQAGNFHGQWMHQTAPADDHTAFAVPHGLGRIPTAVFQAIGPATVDVGSDAFGGTFPGVAVYTDDAHAWTTELVWLKCNVASAKLFLLIV